MRYQWGLRRLVLLVITSSHLGGFWQTERWVAAAECSPPSATVEGVCGPSAATESACSTAAAKAAPQPQVHVYLRGEGPREERPAGGFLGCNHHKESARAGMPPRGPLVSSLPMLPYNQPVFDMQPAAYVAREYPAKSRASNKAAKPAIKSGLPGPCESQKAADSAELPTAQSKAGDDGTQKTVDDLRERVDGLNRQIEILTKTISALNSR
jgi:hypothetical protein